MNIRIALVQMASCEDASSNLRAILAFAAQAKEAGCAAVCFPEACLTGYAPERAAQLALSSESPLLSRLSHAAQAHQIDLLAGYMEREGDALYLTHTLFRPDGTRFSYRKTHLGEKEARYFCAGDSLPVFALSCGLRAGIQLCVETHFPEITQTLSLKGAQIVFAPHAVPGAQSTRRARWQTYIPARAYDNRVYVACCNQQDAHAFPGGCFAADPQGRVIADCFSPQPALAVFEVESAQLCAYSGSGDLRRRYYPARRRPELYGL